MKPAQSPLLPVPSREAERPRAVGTPAAPSGSRQSVVAAFRTLPIVAALLLAFSPTATAQGAPTTLDFAAAIARAAETPAVRAAERQLELARRELDVAASPVNLEAATGYRRTWGELRDPARPEPEDLGGGDLDPLELSAEFGVIPFGPRADRIAAARDGVAAARDALADELARVRVESAGGYFGALRAETDVELAEAALALARERLAAARARVPGGAATPRDVEAAETERAAAAADLEAARRTLELARAEWGLLLGVGTGPVPAPSAPPETRVPADLASLLETARGGGLEPAARALATSERSDVRGAARSVAAAERDYAAAIRSRLPVASVSVGYDRSDADSALSLGAAFDTASYQPSLRMSYDLDSGLANAPSDDAVSERATVRVGVRIPLDASIGAALDANRVALERSRERADLTVERARLDALRALDALLAAERRAEIAALRAAQARTAADDAARRFALGRVGPLEVAGADLEAARASLNATRANDDVVLAQMRFLAALGRSPMEVLR